MNVSIKERDNWLAEDAKYRSENPVRRLHTVYINHLGCSSKLAGGTAALLKYLEAGVESGELDFEFEVTTGSKLTRCPKNWLKKGSEA
jgi:hypothetical protein|tara:strand:+ start:1966 stop:2229 length:264 start_codon:yes stop_codon:yes gene_type:complete